MRVLLIFIFVLLSHSAIANMASTDFVRGAVQSKVDISAAANQDMQGTYTISGTMLVSTPPLPPNEIQQ